MLDAALTTGRVSARTMRDSRRGEEMYALHATRVTREWIENALPSIVGYMQLLTVGRDSTWYIQFLRDYLYWAWRCTVAAVEEKE